MRCYCVMHHGQALQAVEQPTPVPTGTQVLVKVRAASLCHTDLHLWEGYYDMGGGKRLALADRGIVPPLTLSHEIVGTVAAAGEAAEGVDAGATYLVHPWIGCGSCAACLRGEENICAKPQALGVQRPGGFADFVLVPHPRYLIDITGLDPAAAAPLACAGVTTYSALRKFGERAKTDPVLIIGAGGLGLMAIGVLRAMGGKGAIVVDIDPAKREAALAAGALRVIDGKAADAAQQIVAATDGGARAVLDLVGATVTVQLALAAIARGGHIVVCGLMGGDLTVSLPTVPLRPFTLQGSYVGTLDELRELVALARQGGLPAIPVATRPMAEVSDALHELHQGKIVGRTVLVP